MPDISVEAEWTLLLSIFFKSVFLTLGNDARRWFHGDISSGHEPYTYLLTYYYTITVYRCLLT